MSFDTIEKKSKGYSSHIIFKVLRQITYTKLFLKYSSGNYSYDKISVNNLVFNDTCRITARFKDFLIYDDDTEFLRRLYPKKDSKPRLKKILTFYETYSKIFPNYLVLEENKFLYRNIRKKQKLIDAINEIKIEEEENRKQIKKINIEDDNNKLFTSKIREEIKCYQNENFIKNCFKNSFDTEDLNQNSISISLLNKKQFHNFCDDENKNNSIESFITSEMNGSIALIVNTLNDNKIYVKDIPPIIKTKKNKIEEKKNEKKIITTVKKNENKKSIDKNKNLINNTNRLSNRKQQLFKQANLNNNKIKQLKEFSNRILTPQKKIEIDKNLLTSSNGMSNNSRKIKTLFTSSSVLNTNNTNNQDKNFFTTYNSNNNTIINNNNNCLIIKNMKSNTNINKNHRQPTEPNSIELKNHFYKTNTNFNKNSLKNLKNNYSIKEKSAKVSIEKNKDKKNSANKLINRLKRKYASKDFSCKNSDLFTQFKQNLNPKNNIVTRDRLKSQDICNYEENNHKGKTCKNKFFYENNPNLITADTKPNQVESNKNLAEEKITINVRDIIKKDNVKDFNTNLFLTNKKLKETNTEYNLLTEIKPEAKNLNIHNIIENKNVNKENITTNITKNNSKKKTDNNKNISKQKTEYIIKKKYCKNDQKTKTKQEINKANKKNQAQNKIKRIDNSTKNKNIKDRNFKNEYLIKSSENVFDNNNTLNNKYKSISVSSSSLMNKIMEKKFTSNFSDIHMKRYQRKIFQNNNQISDLNILNNLNHNHSHNKNFKYDSPKQEKQTEFKSFLMKNRIKKNYNLKQESMKIFSLKILERINNRHTKRFKGSADNSITKFNTNIIDDNEYENLYKTPVIKNKKQEIFKRYFTNRPSLNNYENELTSVRKKNIYGGNITIKVNKKKVEKKTSITNRKKSNK